VKTPASNNIYAKYSDTTDFAHKSSSI